MEKSNVDTILALTPVQEGMLFHYLKTPGGQEYCEQLNLNISGKINIQLFEEAWNHVVETNEMLRTLYRWEKIEKPVQIVLKTHRPQITYFDVSTTSEDIRDKELEQIRLRDQQKGFDLSKVPFRLTLCRINEEHHMLIISNHHIILDGWSTGIVLKEFFVAYNLLAKGKELIKAVKTPFKAFIKYIQDSDKTQEKKFWETYFKDYEVKTHSESHSKVELARVEHCSLELDGELSQKMKEFARDNRITLSELFYSAWGVLLSRYNDCEDVVFGTTVSGRNVPINGIEDIVGLFINTVPLRIKLNGSTNTKELVRKLNKEVQERRDFEKTSLLDIRSYSGIDSREILFDSIVVVENYPLDIKIMSENNDLKVNAYSITEETNFGMVIGIEVRDSITMTLTCKASVLEYVTIERCLEHFSVILSEMINDPLKAINDISIVSATEKEKLVDCFNATDGTYPEIRLIHKLFEEQVKRTPDNVALVFEDKKLTYRELNEKANSLACVLRKSGVTSEIKVGVMVERSLEMIIGIMGVLKSSGAYVPIDPSYPQDRIEYMLEDSKAQVLLTHSSMSMALAYAGQVINLDDPSLYVVEKENIDGVSQSSDLAYVIYTSGSTGKPKGVLIEHQSITNTLNWRIKHYGFGIEDAVLQMPSFSFDSSVEDIFSPLLSGGRLVLIRQSERLNLDYLRNAIAANNVTHFLIVPSLYKSLLEEIQEELRGMKTITVAGESFTSDLVENHFMKLEKVRLFNEYGPTENSVCSTVFEFDKENSQIVIGKPINNTKCYVLNKYNALQPIGIAGELCVAGIGLARGYLDRPELTSDKFVHNPFEKGERMYRTGDVARWLPNGTIEFLGRVDHQVKIRGYRIETKEIENVLIKHNKIKDAVVWPWEKENKDKYLCAYIVENEEISSDEIRVYLSAGLPEYMIPSYFVMVESIPLTPNGKVDHKALSAPHHNTRLQVEYLPPSNEIEYTLVNVWKEVLSVDRYIGANENFYELGGNSIKAMQIIARINKSFDVSVKLKDFLTLPTIRDLGLEITKASKSTALKIEKVEEREFYELSYNQRKLWTISQIEKENTAYNMTGKLTLDHNVNRTHVEQALNNIVSRHESLRTGFKIIGNTPVQFVQKEHTSKLIAFDLSSYDQGIKQVKREELLEKEKQYVFNIQQGYLFKMILVKLDETTFDLIFNMHHIISDGWSIDILKEEFFHYYDACRYNKRPLLPPIEFQYKDFATWQNRMIKDDLVKEKSHKYWKEQLGSEFTRLNLPYDFSGDDQVHNSSAFVTYVGEETKRKLLLLSVENSMTVFALMFSAFNIFLSKLTGQKDIVCGVPSSGRNHIALHKTVGFFINSIILRTEVNQQMSLLELAKQINTNTLEAIEHQDYPLELVLEEQKMRYPDIQVFFNMLNFSTSNAMERILSFDERHVQKVQNAKFDMVLYLTEYSNGIEISCNYKSSRFNSTTIQYLMNEYLKVIELFANNPESTLYEQKNKNKRRIL
jgi:amino acid adenylation domain-containing protein